MGITAMFATVTPWEKQLQNPYYNLEDLQGRRINTLIMLNPPTSFNPKSIYPRIHKTAYVEPFLLV